MRHALLVVLVLVALVAAGARLRPRPAPEELSARAAGELLALPIRSAPRAAPPLGAPSPAAPAPLAQEPPFWKALLDGPGASRIGDVVTLELGRVLADPSAARLAAEQAGELLSLSASLPSGVVEGPLWKAVLDGPAAQKTSAGTVLKLNGCRHSADPGAGPALEDTYYARLSIARALRELADSSEYGPLTIEGEEIPVAGGANFELQLIQDTHMLEVTVDGQPVERLSVRRSLRPAPPNDALARRSLVRGLREQVAGDPSYGELRIEGEESPAAGGVDLRLEWLGGQQSLSARLPDGTTLRVHRAWTPR